MSEAADRARLRWELQEASWCWDNWVEEHMAQFGISAQRSAGTAQALAPGQLNLSDYEQGRPDEQAACRTGDSRVIGSAAAGESTK